MGDTLTPPQLEDPDEISARVRATLPSLPPAAARVARLILEDPATVSQSTLMTMRKSTGVSEATIVRTARALGYTGYPQLRLALAASSARREPAQVVTGDVSQGDSLEDVIAKLAGAEQQALRETAAHLDSAALAAVADALARSTRSLCFGLAASGLVAADLAQKLTRGGFVCHSPTDIHLAHTQAALLKHGDAAIVISHSGETTESVRVLETAQRAGAVTVAITGSEQSTLADLADHTLVAAGHERGLRPAALSSRIGQLFVVDCVFVALTQRTYAQTNRAIAITRDSVARQQGGHTRG